MIMDHDDKQVNIDLLQKAYKDAILAIIFWVLIITCFVGFIFQILLVLDLLKLNDEDCQDRQLLIVLATIGIFYAGWILNIIIASKIHSNTLKLAQNKVKRHVSHI